MGRGNNKFSALNLNDIYGKKETKPKPSATPTTNGSSGGSHPPGYVLVLSRQKEPSLVAKHDEDKSNSTSSALKKESVENPWAINPFVVSKDSHENEKKAEEHTHANNTKPKRETFCSSKPHFVSNDLAIPHPAAKKIEGEVRGIPTNIRPRRPSPLRDARNWDDDERSSTLPLQLQENRGTYFSDGRNNNMTNHYSGGRYFSDGRNNTMNNHYSGGKRNVNLSRDYPVQGDEGDIDNNNGEREERYGYGMKQNAFHR